MVLRDAARITLAGTAAGLATAVLATRPLAMFLSPGLKPAGPLNFAAVALAMLFTALAAAWGRSAAPSVSIRTPPCGTNDHAFRRRRLGAEEILLFWPKYPRSVGFQFRGRGVTV